MILPICKEKVFKSYPYCSDYLSVANCYSNKLNLFMIHNYFNLKYEPFKGRVDFRYRNSLKNIMKYETIDKVSIQDVKEYIDNKKYVEVILNFKKLEKNYGALFPYFHNYLIYGYDEKQLFLLGYVKRNNCNYYESFKVSYEEYNMALPNTGEKTGSENDIMNNHIFSWNDFQVEKIDENRVTENICKYRNKINVFNNVDIYLCLFFHITVFSSLRITFKNRSLLDSRDFRVLFEHTQIMKNMVDELNVEEAVNNVMMLEKDSKSLLLMANRYKHVSELNRKRKLEKMVKIKLLNMWKNERDILNMLYNSLS